MQRTYAYIPTGHRLSVDKLHTHEFFGDAFKAGRATCALFRSATGKWRAVWSFGDWAKYNAQIGDWINLEHTQTRRQSEYQFKAVINRHTEIAFPGPKMVQWTLK